MTQLRVTGGAPLRGTLQLPGDLQIGQEALLWAALASGDSTLTGLGSRPCHAALIGALQALGVPIARTSATVRVSGRGLHGLVMPPGALDAGESVSTLEILAALLAGQRFGTRIVASGLAATHSLRTVLEPLRARGALIAGQSGDEGDLHAPVSVAPLLPHERLADVEIEIPCGDRATKLALLVSGLYASGITAVSEGVLSPDHTERAFVALGVPLETMGTLAILDTGRGPPAWRGVDWQIPGDFGLAAPLLAAAAVLPGSDLTLTGVAVNRSRAAFFDVLRHAGADVEVTPKGDCAGGEPVADVRARCGRARGLLGFRLSGELAIRSRSEMAAVAILALGARSRSRIRDLSSLRPAPGGIRALSRALRTLGCDCTDYEDGFDLDPAARPQAAPMTREACAGWSFGALCLALVAEGESTFAAAAAVEQNFPHAVGALKSLGASIEKDG